MAFNLYQSESTTKPASVTYKLSPDTSNISLEMEKDLQDYYFWLEATNGIGNSALLSLSTRTSIRAPQFTRNNPHPTPGVLALNHMHFWYTANEKADGYRLYLNPSDFSNNIYTDIAPVDIGGGYYYSVVVFASNVFAVGETNRIYLEAYQGIERANDQFDLVVPKAPIAPANFRLVQAQEKTLELAWDDVSDNENGYYLYYNTSNVKPSLGITLPANTESHTISTLNPGTEYYLWLEGYNLDSGEPATLQASTIGVPLTNVSVTSTITHNLVNSTLVNAALLSDGMVTGNPSQSFGFNNAQLFNNGVTNYDWRGDGDPATVDPFYIDYDLSEEASLRLIRIYFNAGYFRAQDVDFLYLPEGADPLNDTWLVLESVTGNDAAILELEVDQSLGYLRVYIENPVTSASDPFTGIKINEIQLWK
jgi:hypothetical protein